MLFAEVAQVVISSSAIFADVECIRDKVDFLNWDSLHARLNSHNQAWSCKKKSTKGLKHKGNLFKKNLKIKGVKF